MIFLYLLIKLIIYRLVLQLIQIAFIYLDISVSSAQNIQKESKKHLYWRHRATGYYIQRLFNNSNTNQPKENEMIFLYDAKERYKHIKNNSHWNRTMRII